MSVPFTPQASSTINSRSRKTILILLLLLLPVLEPVLASAATPFGSNLIDQGYHDMYNLQFLDAHLKFEQWMHVSPSGPHGPRLRRRCLALRRVRPPPHHRRPALRRSEPLRQPRPPHPRPHRPQSTSTTAPTRPAASPTPPSSATPKTPTPSTSKPSSPACAPTTPS